MSGSQSQRTKEKELKNNVVGREKRSLEDENEELEEG